MGGKVLGFLALYGILRSTVFNLGHSTSRKQIQEPVVESEDEKDNNVQRSRKDDQ